MLDPLRTPKIEGYKWIIKQRQNKLGGGIAIMINNNIQHITKVKQDTEENEEIQWVKIKTKHSTITVGNFYGPQENEERQKVKTIYRNLRTQIIQAKQEGPVILTGDFNAKLHITKQGNTIQNESNNGKIMQNEILKGAGMYPASTHPKIGTWTRQNRKNTTEKSIIDYILVSSTQKRTRR